MKVEWSCPTRGLSGGEQYAGHGLEACEETLPGDVTSSKDASWPREGETVVVGAWERARHE